MLPDKDGPSVGGGQSCPEGEDPSVSLFRDYLRLKTVHPDPDYDAALQFLDRIAEELGLPIKKIERHVINSFLDFREKEKHRLNTSECFTLGDVTTVNMTMVKGGVAYNVIPAEMDVSFDLRIPPTVNLQEFESQIKQWCKEAGDDVTYQFAQKHMNQSVTSIDENDPWWKAFSAACQAMNITLEKEIFPAATDSRFIRAIGVPAIGFSPMNRTPILLHDHNEYLNEQVFLKGISMYERLIPALASVAAFPDEA